MVRRSGEQTLTCRKPFQGPQVLDPISRRIFHLYSDRRVHTDDKSVVPEHSSEGIHQGPTRGFGGGKGFLDYQISVRRQKINYDSESHQLNYRPYSNYWPRLWRCWISLLEGHQLPEAQRYGFDRNAFPRLVQDWDTSRPWSQETGLGKVTEEVEWDVYDGFGGGVGVRGSCIGQKGVVVHRARWLQSTCRRCLSNLSDLTVCEVNDPYQDWRHSDCDCVQ